MGKTAFSWFEGVDPELRGADTGSVCFDGPQVRLKSRSGQGERDQ
jgi:hypothetical protein